MESEGVESGTAGGARRGSGDVSAEQDALREGVREAYSAVALEPGAKHPFPVGREFAMSLGYPAELLERMPREASSAFTGVSNVSIQAPIGEGMRIVDLGCGAGLDSLTAAGRTGPRGHVTGIDFSAEMVARARAAGRECGVGRLDFVRAAVECLPIADASVDLVLVNGLFNLNPYRGEIFRELARIVKPGGRVAGAELITCEPLPDGARSGRENWFS